MSYYEGKCKECPYSQESNFWDSVCDFFSFEETVYCSKYDRTVSANSRDCPAPYAI